MSDGSKRDLAYGLTWTHQGRTYHTNRISDMNDLKAQFKWKSYLGPEEVDQPGAAAKTFSDCVLGQVVAQDWPTYRHDPARSGNMSSAVEGPG